MAKQVAQCVLEQKDCFSYEKMTGAKHGNYRCLDEPVLRNGTCPFYKPMSPELNPKVIDAQIKAYKLAHPK